MSQISPGLSLIVLIVLLLLLVVVLIMIRQYSVICIELCPTGPGNQCHSHHTTDPLHKHYLLAQVELIDSEKLRIKITLTFSKYVSRNYPFFTCIEDKTEGSKLILKKNQSNALKLSLLRVTVVLYTPQSKFKSHIHIHSSTWRSLEKRLSFFGDN